MGALAFPDATVGDFAVNVLTVLILYGPAYLANTGAMLFGKWIPDKIGFDNHKIDGGRIHSDGNRLLGDGKSWEGLFGGGVFSGILVMIAHYIWDENSPPSDRPFIDPLLISDSSDWFWIGNEWVAAFVLGFTLGFSCMLGDMAGSYVKRRQGLKREGEVSSKAPLLDTLPFAIFIFLAAAIFFNDQVMMNSDLRSPIIAIIILTPIIHRSFNILGYRLGLKSVPY
tara:strand:+ start:347 stop:1024 length:678 start_codon:yes stop_codon:yes gene_type:complete